ncbi:MAG TPA: thioredoxin family protein [Clostridia bacterium]|nr:thioredoxin family protein [Clostridia bacterium]
MQKITLFHQEYCPYCREARRWMAELQKENPTYLKLDIELIDERKEPGLADTFDYYFVPTYYIGGEKVHEGVASREKIRDVFEKALI